MEKKFPALCLKLKSVPIREALILKQEMLSIGGDVALPGEVLKKLGGDFDLILLGNFLHFEKLCLKLKIQSFTLPEKGRGIEKVLYTFSHLIEK